MRTFVVKALLVLLVLAFLFAFIRNPSDWSYPIWIVESVLILWAFTVYMGTTTPLWVNYSATTLGLVLIFVMLIENDIDWVNSKSYAGSGFVLFSLYVLMSPLAESCRKEERRERLEQFHGELSWALGQNTEGTPGWTPEEWRSWLRKLEWNTRMDLHGPIIKETNP